jgi:hypothetical protein
MENTYWDGKGKHQAQYNRLVKLMPAMGKCDTVAGEIVRAASRIGHDLYNNGMGNNTSGSLNYLLHVGALDAARKLYDAIYPYTRGALYEGRYNGDAFQLAVEQMIDTAIEFVLRKPELETTANADDIFDFEEEMQHWCEECGDEIDRWGYLCSYCEEEEDWEEDYTFTSFAR